MWKARALLVLLGLLWLAGQETPLFAQEQEEEPEYEEEIPVEEDWDVYRPELYSRGDKTFTISAGVIFPAVFLNNGNVISHNFSPPVGGTGSLAYTYFFGAHYFLGGEIGIKFNHTLADNTVYIVPFGLRTGFQFVFSRFEIPITAVIGAAPQRYLNQNYWGLFLRGGVSAYYRFNPNWSFGLNTDWSWYPQWPKENGAYNPAKNVDANIIGLTLSARYHF